MENKKMSRVVEETLKRVIESVYKEKVDKITDLKGDPPSLENQYLMFEGGYVGFFQAGGSSYFFNASPREGGNWRVEY